MIYVSFLTATTVLKTTHKYKIVLIDWFNFFCNTRSEDVVPLNKLTQILLLNEKLWFAFWDYARVTKRNVNFNPLT